MRLPPIEAHTVWAPVYDSTPNPLLALERRSLAPLLNGRAAGTIIDVGCGTGQWLAHLLRAGANIFGMDLCEAMLNQCRQRDGISGRLVRADAHSLPFASECADVVLSSMSLAYFEDLDLVFEEFARIARSGASIFASDVHPEAIAAGWRRSFRCGTACYEIEHFRYSIEQVLFAANCAGLRLRWCSEARLGGSERPIFCEAGKAELFDALTATPALFLAIWERL
ncbi:MAG TPA: class I SAM-dependent methyltransferase [Bryobacteraceae bacterium]